MRKVSVVRLELGATVLSKQLHNFIKEGTIVDSEVVRGMLQKEFHGFNTYVAIQYPQDQHIGNRLKVNGILQTGGNIPLTLMKIVSGKMSQTSCS